MSVTTLIKGGRFLPSAFRAKVFAKGWTVTIKSAGCMRIMARAARRAIGHMVVVIIRARALPSVAWKLALHSRGALTMYGYISGAWLKGMGA